MVRSLFSVGVLVAALVGMFMWSDAQDRRQEAWTRAMFQATTTVGVDDAVFSDAIQAFSYRYGRCVGSMPPAFNSSCRDLAMNYLREQRSMAAAPPRLASEIDVVNSLFSHITGQAADASRSDLRAAQSAVVEAAPL